MKHVYIFRYTLYFTFERDNFVNLFNQSVGYFVLSFFFRVVVVCFRFQFLSFFYLQ